MLEEIAYLLAYLLKKHSSLA